MFIVENNKTFGWRVILLAQIIGCSLVLSSLSFSVPSHGFQKVQQDERANASSRLSDFDSETALDADSTEVEHAIEELDYLDFKDNPQAALEWSDQYFPEIDALDYQDDIKTLNNAVRYRYLNRVNEMHPYIDEGTFRYGSQTEGELWIPYLDNLFVAVFAQPVCLYENFTSVDFALDNGLFDFTDEIDSEMLNILTTNEFGIDHGYFMGSLIPEPLTNKTYARWSTNPAGEMVSDPFPDNESIQVRLCVPAGTYAERISPPLAPNPTYILQREHTLRYSNVRVEEENSAEDEEPGLQYVALDANLVGRQQLNDKAFRAQNALNQNVVASYNKPGNFTIVPLGLNAGFVVNEAKRVTLLAFDSIRGRDRHVFEKMFLTQENHVYLTTGGSYHTDAAEGPLLGLSPPARAQRIHQELSLNGGETFKHERPLRSKTAVSFILSTDMVDVRFPFAAYYPAATLLHEWFHHEEHMTEAFRDREMFRGGMSFETKINGPGGLKDLELQALVDVLDDDYAKTHWREFIAEAFMAKYHPADNIRNLFRQNVPRTNRLLDNLYDFELPSFRQNVNIQIKDEDIGTDTVAISFNHAVDNVSVEHYAATVYKTGTDSEVAFAITTVEPDGNGLHPPNPGTHALPPRIALDGLEDFTNYEVGVFAVDEAMNLSEGSARVRFRTKDGTPPDLQGPLRGRTVGSKSALLTWNRPTDNAGVSNIKIVKSQGSLADLSSATEVYETSGVGEVEHLNPFVTIDLNGDAVSFHDRDLQANQTYTYFMVALDAAGNQSVQSDPLVITTNEDDDHKNENEDRIRGGDSNYVEIDLSGIGAGLGAAGFSIFGFASTLAGWIGGLFKTLFGSITALLGLLGGLFHNFIVVPVDKDGNLLDDGTLITVDAPPHAPQNLNAHPRQTTMFLEWDNLPILGEAELEWVDPNDLEGLEASRNVSHQVYRKNQYENNGNWAHLGSVDVELSLRDKTRVGYVDATVDPGKTYEYYVVAVVEGGQTSQKSATLAVNTLASYGGNVVRLESFAYPESVLSTRGVLGDNLVSSTFENRLNEFFELVYDESKRAYQIVDPVDNMNVVGLDNEHPDKPVLTVQKNLDSQYWVFDDSLSEDTFWMRNYKNNKVFDLKPLENSEAQARGHLGFDETSDFLVVLENQENTTNVQQFRVLLDTQAPSIPNGLKVSKVTDNSVDLVWDRAEDNVGVLRYVIHDQNGEVAIVPSASFGAELKASYTVTGLDSSGEYVFRVQAVDGSRNASDLSEPVSLRTLPQPPVGLEYREVTHDSVGLVWCDQGNLENIAYYNVYQGGFFVGTTEPGFETAFTVRGLTAYTGYEFQVTAVDTYGGESLGSDSVQVTTLPAPPTGLHPAGITSESVTLNWYPSSTRQVTGYEVYAGDNNPVGRISCSGGVCVPGQLMSYRVTNLDSDTEYSFTVKAFVGSIASQHSNQVTVRTLSPVDVDDVIPDMRLRAAIHMHLGRGQSYWEQPISKAEMEGLRGTLSAASACVPVSGGVVCLQDLTGLGYATGLEDIRLGMNNIHEMPEEIGNLVGLKRLWIDDNQLTALPDSLANLQNLVKIDVSYNRLSPEALSVLDRLPGSTERIIHGQSP